ncbi:uncharacterized protein Z518_03239 [Rhinocladiella mackenziei CBS 650.93]|uniref:Uncharacterized protein n=1 Tax=Rhinocladiella mackenziei CBS 650.93 TaxID=1442369 RepID=A0A0D2HDI6_9EURO|nr:uncharacterized protein Z518_03239 [Rhinocladiella mackenziei CBS 650.93]KIX08583.1 hypothetical protein Z518_03239 [Rhinocladiella mackenziei CBS 650.93]
MEFPIPPEVRTAAPREPQPQRELRRNFRSLLNPLLILVILTLITSFTCTVARLALVVKLNAYWNEGVPTLCYGVVAVLPYGTLDTETAFMFEAISNAIAVQTYDNNSMGLDAVAIYEGSRTGRANILALSAVILTCALVNFILTLCVLQSRINRQKFRGDNLEIPDAIFKMQAATSSTGRIPNMVMMFNPENP